MRRPDKVKEAAEAMVEVTNLATKKAMEAKAEGAAEVREAMDAMKAGEAGIINTTSLNATKKAVDTKAEEAAEALEAVMTNATKKTV